VEGSLKWQADGLGEPQAVKEATEEYRQDMDILGPFIEENCTIKVNAKIESKALYENYSKWCYQNNEMELKNRVFYRQLEIRGFKKEKGAKNKNFIHGITLNQYAGAGFLSGDEEGVTNGVTKQTQKSNPNKVTSINRKKL
jgi:putative DNA primase/helicase